MILTPGSRAYSTGDKSAHVIREVVDGFALPWCEAVEEIALLAVVDDSPESARVAPESMPVCASCREAMRPAVTVGPSPGVRVRDERLERGWTQIELADRLGLTRVVVGNLECGRKAVTKPLAANLARVFGVPAREWLRLEKAANPERARRAA